jgi:hypothetical protein
LETRYCASKIFLANGFFNDLEYIYLYAQGGGLIFWCWNFEWKDNFTVRYAYCMLIKTKTT